MQRVPMLSLLFLAASLLGGSVAVHAQTRSQVTIGIVTDGPWRRRAELVDLQRAEILDLLSSDFDVRLPAKEYLEADWTLAGVAAALDSALADPEIDIVVTLGAIGSHVAAKRAELAKPVIAPVIINAELQEVPSAGVGSGVQNLAYIALPEGGDIEAFLEVVPFRRLALLVNGPLADAVPQLTEKAGAMTAALGLEPVVIRVDESVEATLAELDRSDVEAVYVLPHPQLDPGQWDRLVEALIDRRLPSFSWFGYDEVVSGILAGRRPERFPQRIARRVAINIQRILLGEDPATLPTGFAARGRLAINMATARSIGVYPPWKVYTEAELIDDEVRPAQRQLTLERAVQEAIDVNLGLAAQYRSVAAGAEEINLARSILLPQVDVSADYRVIDEDRAAASFGAQPQRALTGSANLTQVVFDEPAWANLSVRRSVQRAREEDAEGVRLDVALEAAVAYLNLLKAQTFERIERDNLNVTRENLELAEIRESVGTAGAGEVYRWQSQLANNRQAVVDANTGRNLAEIELNRILNRPLEESFGTQETDLSDPTLLSGQERLYGYIDNPWSFRVFRRFMAEEALATSPELAAFDAAIEAQRRALSSRRRAFYLPSLALVAGVTNIFDTSGAGGQPPPGLPDGSFSFPTVDDVAWSVGVRLSYPLFTGASRFAEKGRATQTLAQLDLERGATAQRVEQRMRSALHQMGASLANIDLSRDAAEAAGNNIRLVRDAYSRGVASIVELLDAQNAARVAELLAATAIYDFLIDLMKVERAANEFDFFISAEQREDYFDRLDTYFEQAGGPEPRR